MTVADIKATRDSLKADVQSVIDSAKKIKGADVSAAEKAWTDLDTAVTALPDTATLMDAAGVLLTKVAPLTTALAKIKTLVTPDHLRGPRPRGFRVRRLCRRAPAIGRRAPIPDPAVPVRRPGFPALAGVSWLPIRL